MAQRCLVRRNVWVDFASRFESRHVTMGREVRRRRVISERCIQASFAQICDRGGDRWVSQEKLTDGLIAYCRLSDTGIKMGGR